MCEQSSGVRLLHCDIHDYTSANELRVKLNCRCFGADLPVMASLYYGGHNAAYAPYFNATATSRYYGHQSADGTASPDGLISGVPPLSNITTASPTLTTAAGIYPHQPYHLSFSPFSTDGSGCWETISAAAAVAAASAVQKRVPFVTSHPMMPSSASSCGNIINTEREPFPTSSLLPYTATSFCDDDFETRSHHHHQQQQHQQQHKQLKPQPKHCTQQQSHHPSSFSVTRPNSSDQLLVSPCGQIVRCSPSATSYRPIANGVLSSSPPSTYCSPDASLVDASPPPPSSLHGCVQFDSADLGWTTSAACGRGRNGGNIQVDSASTCRYASKSSVRSISK